jgi:hypothetical protein
MVIKSGRTKKKTALARKTVRKAVTPRARAVVARSRRVSRTARREAGSITEAAARVVRSGAILVGHTSQRIVASAARKASSKVHDMLQNVAHATAGVPRATPRRRARR